MNPQEVSDSLNSGDGVFILSRVMLHLRRKAFTVYNWLTFVQAETLCYELSVQILKGSRMGCQVCKGKGYVIDPYPTRELVPCPDCEKHIRVTLGPIPKRR